MPLNFHLDKRKHRSEKTQKALYYQLEHVLKEFDMDLIVLADHNGLVVASAGDKKAAGVFAVYAESLANGEEPHPALSQVLPETAPDRITCTSITLDELPLYLCAVMDGSEKNAQAFQRARIGVQRIYYSTSAFPACHGALD